MEDIKQVGFISVARRVFLLSCEMTAWYQSPLFFKLNAKNPYVDAHVPDIMDKYN